ncbi:hypothetical protein [Lysobacter sp. HA35]
MRIVEFVGFVVAVIALFAWMTGERHTLASTERDRQATRDADDNADR